MPDTAEHRADMFALAQERKRAAKPVWDRKIRLGDVFRNENMTFEQRRDAITKRLRASGWLDGRDMFDDLVVTVEGLENAEDVTEFDGWWSDLYDIADYDRVWIDTVSVPR